MSHLWLYELVWVIQGSVFAYFLSLNAVYALVLILSVSWCRNYKKKSWRILFRPSPSWSPLTTRKR